MAALRDSQLRMAGYLRDPEGQAPPAGIEERRLRIYRDLIYNNVEGFIRGGFPVLHSLYEEAAWQDLVRSFMDVHRCRSPYFLKISEEFIHYLAEEHEARAGDPPFLAELAHYEWVELALDVATDELPPAKALEGAGDIALSPLAWVLAYQFPVHRIGPGFCPEAPQDPVYLVVYRDRSDVVRFMEVNAATARLLTLVQERGPLAIDKLVRDLAGEMQVAPEAISAFAREQVQSFLEASVLLPA